MTAPTRTNPPPNQPSHTDRSINRILNSIDNEKGLSEKDLIDVYTVAQVDYRLEEYRQNAQSMTRGEITKEQHNSEKLAKFMTAIGDPRPAAANLCHAHHIVSGRHPNAQRARMIMAFYKLRIDDALNGCWLPRSSASQAQMPGRLRNAVPHSRIHRKNYFAWLGSTIKTEFIKSRLDLERTLINIAFKLQTSTFPSWVMLKAHEEIPTDVV